MGESRVINPNDTTRAIERVIENLKAFNSELVDPRVKALIVTKLEEAAHWSYFLIKEEQDD